MNIIGEARAPSKRFFRGMRSACRVAVGWIVIYRCKACICYRIESSTYADTLIFCGTHRVPWCWCSSEASTEHRGVLMWPTPRTTKYRILSWSALPSTTVNGQEPHRRVQLSTICGVAVDPLPTPRGHRIQYRGAKAEQLRGALRTGLRSGGKRGGGVDHSRGHANGRAELTHVRSAG